MDAGHFTSAKTGNELLTVNIEQSRRCESRFVLSIHAITERLCSKIRLEWSQRPKSKGHSMTPWMITRTPIAKVSMLELLFSTRLKRNAHKKPGGEVANLHAGFLIFNLVS